MIEALEEGEEVQLKASVRRLPSTDGSRPGRAVHGRSGGPFPRPWFLGASMGRGRGGCWCTENGFSPPDPRDLRSACFWIVL